MTQQRFQEIAKLVRDNPTLVIPAVLISEVLDQALKLEQDDIERQSLMNVRCNVSQVDYVPPDVALYSIECFEEAYTDWLYNVN